MSKNDYVIESNIDEEYDINVHVMDDGTINFTTHYNDWMFCGWPAGTTDEEIKKFIDSNFETLKSKSKDYGVLSFEYGCEIV